MLPRFLDSDLLVWARAPYGRALGRFRAHDHETYRGRCSFGFRRFPLPSRCGAGNRRAIPLCSSRRVYNGCSQPSSQEQVVGSADHRRSYHRRRPTLFPLIYILEYPSASFSCYSSNRPKCDSARPSSAPSWRVPCPLSTVMTSQRLSPHVEPN